MLVTLICTCHILCALMKYNFKADYDMPHFVMLHSSTFATKPCSCFLHGQRIRPNLLTELLTHWGRVIHICVSKLTIIGLDNGLSPGRRQDIFWTIWIIVNYILRNILRWNFDQNLYIFIQENPFENAVWKMEFILSRLQWVSHTNIEFVAWINNCIHIKCGYS